MTLLNSRRRYTAGALATTLAASSMGFSGCASQQAESATASEQPSKVASVMQTATQEASTSTFFEATPGQETSLTARGFLGYLDEEQRAALLGPGLDLNELSQAQLVTSLRVLESVFNEDVYKILSAIIIHLSHEPTEDGTQHHFLNFSQEPSVDRTWNLSFNGPVAGVEATFYPDGQITFQSGHIDISADDVAEAAEDIDAPFKTSRLHESALSFYQSLTDAQRTELQNADQSDTAGLKGSELSPEQQEMLVSIASNWVELADPKVKSQQHEEIVNTISNTYFSWIPHEDNGLQFLISGPEVFIQYKESKPVDPNQAGLSTPDIHSEFYDPNPE
ncbi:DUF3500 domain-containing protein [Corynebacterium callunae]|uniref:DUF3500 domain-containing protein n=1 Tax=Corynebacterium callunae TaxID=1721 RepID=UPI003982BAE4